MTQRIGLLIAGHASDGPSLESPEPQGDSEDWTYSLESPESQGNSDRRLGRMT